MRRANRNTYPEDKSTKDQRSKSFPGGIKYVETNANKP